MDILCFIKQVPDTPQVHFNLKTNSLIRDGIQQITNPFDLHALELALQIKDSTNCNITAICMGPKSAEKALRDSIAMGVDRAYLLNDSVFAGSDTYATSLVLAAFSKYLGCFDLLFFGKQAIDGDTGQVGPGVAERLGIPFASCVKKMAIYDKNIVAERVREDGVETLEIVMPCAISVLREANTPRIPSLAGKLKSIKSEITVIKASDLGLSPENTGFKGSPTWVKKTRGFSFSRSCHFIEGSNQEKSEYFLLEWEKKGLLKNV